MIVMITASTPSLKASRRPVSDSPGPSFPFPFPFPFPNIIGQQRSCAVFSSAHQDTRGAPADSVTALQALQDAVGDGGQRGELAGAEPVEDQLPHRLDVGRS